jgi:uncharacterized MAPEG superfamily protein
LTENPPLFLLGLAVLIGIVHVLLQAMTATKDTGLKWNAGPRDEPRPVGVLAGRMERAFANFRETFPLFAVAMIGAYLGNQVTDIVIGAGWAYVIARALYIPLYAFGVTGLRSLVWFVAFGAILVILGSLLL